MPETAGSSGGSRSTSGWKRFFFLGAAVVVLLLVFGFGAAANSSTFCTSCHDGQRGKSSLVSSSHANFDCLKCHGSSVLGNTGDLIRRTVKQVTNPPSKPVTALGLVNDQKCLSCHTLKKVSPSGDIRIEHTPHSDKNIQCTQCHNRVAHPSTPEDEKNVAFTNKLKMGNCGSCHDNKTAPSTCSTCHKSDRLPGNHKEATWVRAHGKSALGGDMSSCQTCHSWNESFCQTCHTSIKPNSHNASWVNLHKNDVQKGREGCDFCHKPKQNTQGQTVSTAPSQADDFCTKCHSQRKPQSHDSMWVRVHKNGVATNKAGCEFCHTSPPDKQASAPPSQKPEFCVTCHTSIKPLSHEQNWVRGHKDGVAANKAGCDFCHKPGPNQSGPVPVSQQPDFCNKCHTSIKPASHNANWIHTHKPEVQKNRAACEFCHKQPAGVAGGQVAASQSGDFCVKCHQQTKPTTHDASWVRVHKNDVPTNRATCEFCHGDITKVDICSTCHTKVKPVSHETNWLGTHKTQVATNRAGCDFCHKAREGKTPAVSQTADFCTKCHSVTKAASHDGSWVRVHGKQVSQNKTSCDFCHKAPPGAPTSAVPASQNPEFCNTCHKSTRPVSHNSDWWRTHGPEMVKDKVGCIQCHANNNQTCQTCHKIIRPSSHTAKYISAHGKEALQDMQSCQLCHGQNQTFCQTCHKNVRPTSHDDKWRGTHKDPAKSNIQSCTICHEPQTFCNKCHIFPLPQKQ